MAERGTNQGRVLAVLDNEPRDVRGLDISDAKARTVRWWSAGER